MERRVAEKEGGWETKTERERQTDLDKQIDRYGRDRQTYRQTYIQTYRQTDKRTQLWTHIHRQTDRYVDTHTGRHIDR
jgi:hypothetical protein